MAANQPFDLRAKFRALSRVLRASFDATSVGGRHPVEKGIRRETALCEFLRQHLPPKYGVARGEIVAVNGWISKQIDLVIYDAFHAPLLQDCEASGVFPAECVYAAIEVKPKLDQEDLVRAVETIRSVKALPRTALVEQHGGHRLSPHARENPPIFGAVFALKSSDVPESIVPRLAQLHRALAPDRWLDAICILDAALIYHFALVPGVPGPAVVPTVLEGQGDVCLGYYPTGEDTLLLFYLFLLHQLNAKDLFPPNLLDYVAAIHFPGPRLYAPEA